jgi:hypothetical protein
MTLDSQNQEHRSEWFNLMAKIAKPVIEHAAADKLKNSLPKYTPPGFRDSDVVSVAHFEAIARTLAGIAPWLESESIPAAEMELQGRYRELARVIVGSLFDKTASDYVEMQSNPQCLVEAAYVVLAILRAPTQLWTMLNEQTRESIISALISSREIKPFLNNWILFSGLIESFLHRQLGHGDLKRVYWILQKINSWYVGDGFYKDGNHFHFDYYNSIVIHPMLLNMVDLLPNHSATVNFKKNVLSRAQRHGVLLERMISPDGSMPPIGRSLTYRTGVLHLLAELSLKNMLPISLKPENVQQAISSVLRRHFSSEDSWDELGWLTIGSVGRQESLAEFYISRGSLYMALMAFLPMGLSANHDFWNDGGVFTSRSFYSGVDMPVDRFTD